MTDSPLQIESMTWLERVEQCRTALAAFTKKHAPIIEKKEKPATKLREALIYFTNLTELTEGTFEEISDMESQAFEGAQIAGRYSRGLLKDFNENVRKPYLFPLIHHTFEVDDPNVSWAPDIAA